MKHFHVFPYLSPQTARSIRRAWNDFCENPTPQVKAKLCNKIRHYFIETPMMTNEGHAFLNKISNEELLSDCKFDIVRYRDLPDQETLCFNTSKGMIRVWCTLKTFLTKETFGKILGYPQCCINHYVSTKPEILKKSYGDRRPTFSAINFTPCSDCANKNPKLVLEEIDERRFIRDHYDEGEKIISCLANILMVREYEEAVEVPDNDLLVFHGFNPEIDSFAVVTELRKTLKIEKIRI